MPETPVYPAPGTSIVVNVSFSGWAASWADAKETKVRARQRIANVGAAENLRKHFIEPPRTHPAGNRP
jgi:hypothetical protein